MDDSLELQSVEHIPNKLDNLLSAHHSYPLEVDGFGDGGGGAGVGVGGTRGGGAGALGVVCGSRGGGEVGGGAGGCSPATVILSNCSVG